MEKKENVQKILENLLNFGIEAFVAGGGIILSGTPLYKSEGPTQVALIMIRFLQLLFKRKIHQGV